jgi:NADH-quinone oxidoreductase subunit J
MSAAVIGALAVLILVSAVWVVTLRNLFRAALSLGLVLLGVAAVFIALDAEFLGFVQILVYVGAILTLVVFAIMLTARLHTDPAVSASRQRLPAAIASLALFGLLAASTATLTAGTGPAPAAPRLDALGQRLVTELVLPFEVVSLLLVGAVVGAIAVASPRGKGSS